MGDKISAILEGLNSEQKRAVSCVDGPVLIVAGAGSGKTRVLTSRIAYIIAKGCDPSRIMALTFTKKAANEMKERISLMVGDERVARKITMGTFHSVFIRFLRTYADSLGYPKEFTIYDQSDSTSAVKACIKEMGLDDKVYKPKDVLARISMAKNNLITPGAYRRNPSAIQNDAAGKKPKIVDIYDMYWSRCRKAGVMDFDDILLNMNILLRDNPDAFDEISRRFDFIMVDEYQDTNYAQYLIIKKLSARHQNICVVGDDSQSIYAFRGAKIENILNFKKDFPAAQTFRLEQNYRSTQTIVDAANSVIAKNQGRIPKKCFSTGDVGEKIRLINAFREKDEAEEVVSDIKRRICDEKAEYQDFAILYRTNSQSHLFEDKLRNHNIPYLVYSGNAFYERAEVKDVLAYLKLIVNVNDEESFKRIVNKPARGIGDTSVTALMAAASAHECSLFRAAYAEDLETFGLRSAAVAKIREFCNLIQKHALATSGYVSPSSGIVKPADAYDAAKSIAEESGIYAFFKADNSSEGQSRTSNVEELLNTVKRYVDDRHNSDFENLVADAIDEGNPLPDDYVMTDADLPVVTLGDFLEDNALLSSVDVEGDDDSNKVALMTIHSAKGLEYPYVYVVGMEENIFPTGGFLAAENEIEEERRLFYVAVTRAKKAVTLSFAQIRMRNGKTESNSPSRFVREIDRQYIKNPLPDGTRKVNFDDDDFDSDFGFGRGFGAGHGESSYGSRSGASYGSHSGSSYGYSGSSKPSYGSSQSYGRSGAAHSETRRPDGPSFRRPATTTPSAPQRSSGITKPRPINRPVMPAKPAADFQPSPISALRVGQRVEHNRFGYGVIKDISRSGNDMKATIAFDNYGDKVLLLQYAKVRIVEEA